ncbi:MAG: hypothetical protein PHV30_09370 [Candidatus Margulisbacteria bacterium]|nr:hypothetical protein [Candidatus Margulisiibacteriota bacterium]
MRNKILFMIMLLTMISYSAVFNRVNTVINTPAALPGVIGQFELGLSYAPYYLSGIAYWEDDYYLNYSLTDFLMLGITRINANDVAGNIQLLLAKDLFMPNLNLAFGVDNIMAKDKASTFDTLNEKYINNMSVYAVTTYRMDQWELSAGLGEGRLANFYNPYTLLLSNLFYSVSYYFSKAGKNTGRISFEYDSRDFNLGLVFPVTDQLTFKLALTQLPFRSGNNPNYGDIPFENVTIGLDFKMNFFTFYGEEYNRFSNKIKDIDEKSGIIGEKYQGALANAGKADKIVQDLTADKDKLHAQLTTLIRELQKEKDQLKSEVNALRDVIEAEGFKNVQTLKEDIMKHYYRALQYYYDERYFDAIEELTKAKMLNPNIPEIYTRLGSIYWSLGLKEESLENWRKAYELDKDNESLNNFLKTNNIDLGKKEEKK